MKFWCIADEETVRGFSLAGVAGCAVSSVAQAAAALEQATADPECGIVVLTQQVAAGIHEKVETLRLERERPLVVEIPGPEGPLPGRKSLRQFVREAVGFRVG